MRFVVRKNGETRVIKRFLFLPRIIDGECRWLEWAYIQQKFHRFGKYDYLWQDIKRS